MSELNRPSATGLGSNTARGFRGKKKKSTSCGCELLGFRWLGGQCVHRRTATGLQLGGGMKGINRSKSNQSINRVRCASESHLI